MITGVKTFIQTYWREVAIVVMFLVLQSGISEAKRDAARAYDYAASAADYARSAWYSAEDAAGYANDAVDYASEAADNSWYCTF